MDEFGIGVGLYYRQLLAFAIVRLDDSTLGAWWRLFLNNVTYLEMCTKMSLFRATESGLETLQTCAVTSWQIFYSVESRLEDVLRHSSCWCRTYLSHLKGRTRGYIISRSRYLTPDLSCTRDALARTSCRGRTRRGSKLKPDVL